MNYALWVSMSFVVNSNRLYNLLFKGWFRIKGRSSRQEYILRFLIMWVFVIIETFFIGIMESIDDSKPNFTFVFCLLILIKLTILLILSLTQVFFVTHRRLHDLNASGWWQLITFIPFGQLLMIGFIFFKGTVGPNKYGPPPEY